jgi:flagellar basal body-associated protein FliL
MEKKKIALLAIGIIAIGVVFYFAVQGIMLLFSLGPAIAPV